MKVWNIGVGSVLESAPVLTIVDVGYDSHRISFSPLGDRILITNAVEDLQVVDIYAGECRLGFNSEGTDIAVFSRAASVVLM